MNTKTTALRRHYGKLEPIERFRLLLSARERGDDCEIAALNRTAPEKTYRMMGWPYAGMLQGVHIVAWAATTDVLRCGVDLMAAWFQETANGLPTAEATREPDGDGFNWWAVGLEFARSALAAWEGLALFCDELGVTVDQALEYAPATDDAKLVTKQAEMFLAMDGDFRHWLAYDHLGLAEEKAETFLAAGEKVIQERRESHARDAAGLFRKIWQRETG